jgi:hypothetical protein
MQGFPVRPGAQNDGHQGASGPRGQSVPTHRGLFVSLALLHKPETRPLDSNFASKVSKSPNNHGSACDGCEVGTQGRGW